uniref:Uncharacterized protein n=1 Tax=Rhizophora mucronata TaxID=61149 RepID=A0A2P2NXD0_RHIMU
MCHSLTERQKDQRNIKPIYFHSHSSEFTHGPFQISKWVFFSFLLFLSDSIFHQLRGLFSHD